MTDRYFADPDLSALYDAFNPPGPRADFAFYTPLVMAARAVLDVGCGTGALLHAARLAGHAGRLCGVDPGAGMIAAAADRADIEWILGDLTAVACERVFDLVVMTGHAFQALVTDEDIRCALSIIRRALTDDGRFAFETRNPAAQVWEDWPSREPAQVTGPSGRPVRMARRVETPFDGRTVCLSHTFTSDAWDAPRVSRSTLRFLDTPALMAMLGEAGLTIEAQFGDWDRGPLDEGSQEIITLARRG